MSIKDRLCQHFSSVGIDTKQSARFASLIDKWINNSGPQWTVDRLKSLAAAYRSHLQNPSVPYTVPNGWETRRNRKGETILKDGLAHSMMYCTSGKSLKIAQAFFRSYQVITSDKLLKSQIVKFVETIQKPLPTSEGYSNILESFSKAQSIEGSIAVPRVPMEEIVFIPLSHWGSSDEKRSPVYNIDHNGSLHSMPSISRTDIATKQFTELMCSDIELNRLWKDHTGEVSNTFTGSDHLPYMWYTEQSDLPAGRIGFIPEPGMKLRCVANPSLVIQALGEPLKRKLERLSQLSPNIYTFDQESGQRTIVEWLGKGRKVWSFDATSFTDHFPYSLQKIVLDRLRSEGWVSEFDQRVMNIVVNKHWVMPESTSTFGTPKVVKWNVGQPMGFGPSFHLATITHDHVVRFLGSTCDADINDSYVIVGDDIAICDEKLALSYSRFMKTTEVAINMDKSIISSEFAEFCGKLITPSSVVPSVKTKMVTSQDQLMRLLDYYGSKGYNYLNEREQSWAIKAILPIEMGGLGYSPEGMKYSEYLSVLNLDNIQVRYLFNELDRFFNVPTKQRVQTTLEEIAKFYDENDVGLARQDWIRLAGDSDLALSAWTGLPVHVRNEDNDSSSQPQILCNVNTYRYIYDNAVRQLLAEPRNPFHKNSGEYVNNCLDIIRNITNSISGYILDSEKPPLRPIRTLGEQTHDSTNKRPSTTDFDKFINGGKKPFGAFGISEENKEEFTRQFRLKVQRSKTREDEGPAF